MADGMIPSEPAALGLAFGGNLTCACTFFTRSIWRYAMTSQENKLITTIPDLRDFTLDRLAELGATPLANSIALYRERLKENGIPLSSFNARI